MAYLHENRELFLDVLTSELLEESISCEEAITAI